MTKTDAELRAQHTCVRSGSSMRCIACNAGVPYPHEPLEELKENISNHGSRVNVMQKHVLPALRDAAMAPCRRSNCGSVCLCMRCHARKALEVLDPTWRP